MDNIDTIPNSTEKCAAVILAAGKSTRMRSDTPKTLHHVCGLPLTSHVIRACKAAGIDRVIVVVGHQAETVMSTLGDAVEYAVQEKQRGTGDAVSAASHLLQDWSGDILVLAGDAPLIQASTIKKLLNCKRQHDASVAMLTAISEDATGYGRIVRGPGNRITSIVEHRDATPEQRMITEWNPSVYVFGAESLWRSLDLICPNNEQGEFYLTDTIRILSDQGERIESIVVDNADETLGVNTRVELARVNRIMLDGILVRHMLAGVSFTDPANTYVDVDVTIGQDTLIHPNTYLLGKTSIGSHCVIGPGTSIRDCSISPHCSIVSSQLVESTLSESVKVGPFANLRPGTFLGANVKIGDFVEVKNSTLGDNVQVNHLTYLGDSEVGRGTNIGAGTITCNYDGYKKHKTCIGAGAFIGSHSTLVAPVTIGDGGFVAAGSTITSDVPENALAIARAQVVIKEQWAARYRAAKRTKD